MEAYLHIVADTRDEAQAAFDELAAQFGPRLTVLRALAQGDDGGWTITTRLDGEPAWIGYSRVHRTQPLHDSDPGQAVQELDAQLGYEINARDYLSEYGFDVTGAILQEAETLYNAQDERAELHIDNPVGTVRVWREGDGWVVSYRAAGRVRQVWAEQGALVRTLYEILNVLLDESA